jgi:hypothetical protein
MTGKHIKPSRVPREALECEAKKTFDNLLEKALRQYELSMWVRGDNTVENAKKEEYGNALDARALYPDVKAEGYAKEYYADLTQ